MESAAPCDAALELLLGERNRFGRAPLMVMRVD
jgi:hypothetical protein